MSPVFNGLSKEIEYKQAPFGVSANSMGFTSRGRTVFFFRFPSMEAAFITAKCSAWVGGKATRTSEA